MAGLGRFSVPKCPPPKLKNMRNFDSHENTIWHYIFKVMALVYPPGSHFHHELHFFFDGFEEISRDVMRMTQKEDAHRIFSSERVPRPSRSPSPHKDLSRSK